MPVNPNKEERKMRRFVNRIFESLSENDTISYKDLIRDCCLTFDVSILSVKKWIQDFYIEGDVMGLEDDVLTKKEVKK